MKIEWAKKVAEVIQEVEDPHGSRAATNLIIGDICAGLNAEFPEFEFSLMESGEVAVKKAVSTYSMGKSDTYKQ